MDPLCTMAKRITKKIVHVTVEGGVIQDVECPSGIQVLIRDYDVDGSETDLAEDDSGDEFIESIWE